MRIALCISLVLFIPCAMQAQVTFARGNHALELSGVMNAYFSRFTDSNDNDKYGFDLRDARLVLIGETHPRFTYEFTIDFAEINGDDRFDYFIVDAFVNVDLPAKFDFYGGFQRLPVSRNSSTSFSQAVFSRRPPMTGGSLYYRRGLGLTMRKKFANDQINLYGGVFNNNGSIRNITQENPGLTYTARADFSFPAKTRYVEVDIRHTPVPLFGIGFSGLYTENNEELQLELFPLQVEGEKVVASADIFFMYQGFTLQAEFTQAWMDRYASAGPELADKFNSQGFHASANYYFKSIKSVFGVRIEHFNPDDASVDEYFTAMTLGYNFLVDQSHDVVLRADYRFFLDEDILAGTPYNENELNVGLQFRF